MKKFILISVFVIPLGLLLCSVPYAEAFYSPHPLKLYEQGHLQLTQYHGQNASLQHATQLFSRIIEKHPDSPFGYLGMSQVKTIEAYRYDQHYNMKMIQEEALPMALKAMRMGPPLVMVQNNYDRFEEIMKANDQNQEHVRVLLQTIPDKSQTYFALGDFLYDQNDFEKAVEFYKIVLRSDGNKLQRLKATLRIAWVYLNEIRDPEKALKYYQSALEIQEELPGIHANMGQAYLALKDYRNSVTHFQKAMEAFETPFLREQLWEAQGLLFEEQGQVDLAISLFEKTIQVNNYNTTLLYRLGNLYYKKSDYSQAYQQYQKVIRAGATIPEALYLAGRSALSMGQKDLAREYCAQYLDIKNDGQEADWIRENIPDLSHR